ncbi:hypothetical protein MYO4S_00179 [Serratia phage 4S]|nr:hypothetical protein MYO4S_00179 [Serratia phage 4S]
MRTAKEMRDYIETHKDAIALQWANILTEKCSAYSRHLNESISLHRDNFFTSASDIKIGLKGINAVMDIMRKRGFKVTFDESNPWFEISW